MMNYLSSRESTGSIGFPGRGRGADGFWSVEMMWLKR